VYGRTIDGREFTFDFGAGLINDNLLIVDRETNSIWSQLHGKAISGPMEGTPLPVVPSMQVTWKYWRSLYPETWVMWESDSEGRPYYYRSHRPGEPSPTEESKTHDTSALGLGLVYRGNTMFFAINELRKAQLPAIAIFGDHAVAVYYDEVAKGAWAIDGDLNVIPAVLVYDWAWFDFFPDSGTYMATPGF